MKPMTVDEVAAAVGIPPVGAELGGDAIVTSVEFDSRKVAPGTLFLALVGDQVDGHRFAAAAAAAGAVAVLGTRDIEADIPLLKVTDPLAALAGLATVSARALIADGLTVLGVTGSAGKTSTKDLIAAIASAAGPTVFPPESFNNELGHPYTVLRAGVGTKYLVLELSARGVGHIAMLTTIAPPTIGVVLNVGSAHLGEFGSVDAIATAKGELVESLPPGAQGGVAILNADDGRVAAMSGRTHARVVSYGTSADADIRAEDVEADDRARARFTLHTPEGTAEVQLALSGHHQVSNALAAAAVGIELGLTPARIAEVLATSGPASKWRMEITDRADGVTVINDAYNANPDSVKAALRALVTIGRGRRTWAVLGLMGELGDATREAHDEIGRLVVRLNVDRLLAVGPAVRPLHLGAHLEGSWGGESEHLPDLESAIAILLAELEPGDVVLVKASRSVGLERVAAAVLAAPISTPIPDAHPDAIGDPAPASGV